MPSDPHDARVRRRGRRPTRARASSGGVDGGAGPAIDGNGSMRASARRTVRGGTISFSRCDDRRALHLAAQRRLAGQLSSTARRRPRRSRGRARRRRAGRRSSRAAAAAGSPQSPPRANEPATTRDRLEERRTDERADEPGERRVRRARAAVQDVRREARADVARRPTSPASESAVATSPRRSPPSAASATIASAIQSTRVTLSQRWPGERSIPARRRYTAARPGA